MQLQVAEKRVFVWFLTGVAIVLVWNVSTAYWL
jgi:hypothetical protein